MALNHITLMGRITKDPELKQTQNGLAVTTFSIACDRDYSGGEEKQTDFIDIVAWRKTAEFVCKYFKKGSMAIIDGRLQLRDWTDKDGNKRKAAEVVANNIYFGSSKKDDPAPAPAPTGNAKVDDLAGKFPAVFVEDDSELPF